MIHFFSEDLLPPSTSSETFLTDEDFLRPLNGKILYDFRVFKFL